MWGGQTEDGGVLMWAESQAGWTKGKQRKHITKIKGIVNLKYIIPPMYYSPLSGWLGRLQWIFWFQKTALTLLFQNKLNCHIILILGWLQYVMGVRWYWFLALLSSFFCCVWAWSSNQRMIRTLWGKSNYDMKFNRANTENHLLCLYIYICAPCIESENIPLFIMSFMTTILIISSCNGIRLIDFKFYHPNPSWKALNCFSL